MKRNHTNNLEAKFSALIFALAALLFAGKYFQDNGLMPPQLNELLPRQQDSTAQR